MRCVNCGTAWDDIENVNFPMKCPFCGLDVLNCKNNNALKIIVDEYGESIFEDSKRLFCALNDVLGNRTDELLSIRMLEMQGFHNYYKRAKEENSVEERNRELFKAKRLMENLGLKKARINTIDSMYRIAFDIDEPKFTKANYKDSDYGYLLLARKYEKEEQYEIATKLSEISAEAGNVKAVEYVVYYTYKWGVKIEVNDAIKIISREKEYLPVRKVEKYKKILKYYTKCEEKSVYMNTQLYWFCLKTGDFKNGLPFFEKLPNEIAGMQKDYRLLAYIYNLEKYGFFDKEKAFKYAEKDIVYNCFFNRNEQNDKSHLINRDICSIENSILIYLKHFKQNVNWESDLKYEMYYEMKTVLLMFDIENIECDFYNLLILVRAYTKICMMSQHYEAEIMESFYYKIIAIKNYFLNNLLKSTEKISNKDIDETIEIINQFLEVVPGLMAILQYNYLCGEEKFNNLKLTIKMLKESGNGVKFLQKMFGGLEEFWERFCMTLYDRFRDEYELTDIYQMIEIGTEQGDIICAYLQAKMNYEGDGTSQNIERAKKLFRENNISEKLYEMAYKNNNHNAYFCLGDIYATGYFAEQDLELAKDYFIYCAKEGDPEAKSWLDENLVDVDEIEVDELL